MGKKVARMLIEAVLLFLKGIAIIALLVSAAIAAMYLFAWLGPLAMLVILSIIGGLFIGWKLGERKGIVHRRAK